MLTEFTLDLCLAFISEHFQWLFSLGFLLPHPLRPNFKLVTVRIVGFCEGLEHVLELLGQNEGLAVAVFCLSEEQEEH